MRRVVLLLSTMSLTLLLLSGVALAQPAPRQVPDASCQLSGPSSLEAFFRSSAIAAQTFKAEHTGFLTSAQVQVKDVDTEPTPIIMEIRSVDPTGTPTELVLASTTIPAADVPDRQFGEAATGHFRPGARVEAGEAVRYRLAYTPGEEGDWNGSSKSCAAHTLLPMRVDLNFRVPPQILTYSSRPSSGLAPPLDPLPGRGRPRTARFATRPPRWGTTQHRWPSHPRPGCRCAGVARQRVGYRAVVCAAASSTLYGREAHAHLIAWIVLLRVLFHEWNRIAGIGDESCVNAPP